MTFTNSIKIAIRALGANKLRTALTMLGMIIGVGAVIALMSIGQGAQRMITSQIQAMGTNLLFVRPGTQSQGGVRTAAGAQPTLTLEDAQALAEPVNAPSVAKVAPESSAFVQVLADGINLNTRVIGTTPDYEEVRNFRIAEGEFITKNNVDGGSTVVVLGSGVAAQLFPGGDAVGRSLKIASFSGNASRSVTFRVVGVMEAKGGTGALNQDDQIFVPITTLQRRLTASRNSRGGQTVQTINIQAADEDLMDQAVQEIGELLRTRHRKAEDDFTIQSQQDMLAVANQITGIMTMLLGSIAGISLLVGGIGIMNIMLVSVTERTREIGIRKAVGAKRRDILTQFVVESIVVSVLGGALGVAAGFGVSRLLQGVNFNGQALQTVVSVEAVLLAFGVSAAVGLFFGIYPAMRAAALNPIEALRYE